MPEREKSLTVLLGHIVVLPDRSILAVVPIVSRGGIPKKGPTEINYIRSDHPLHGSRDCGIR